MPAILIDSPIITPQPSTNQSMATDSVDQANEGQPFRKALDNEMRNQAPENNHKTGFGKSDKAEDDKARDTGTPDANSDSGITQPDLAALQIPLTNPVAAQPAYPAKGDTQELTNSPRMKQGMAIDLKSAVQQNTAGNSMAMQAKDILRQGLNTRDGGKIQPDQEKDAHDKDTRLSQPMVLTQDQRGLADNAKPVNQAGHDKLMIRQDVANALPKTGDQPDIPETIKSDSLSILSSDIRPAANQPLAPMPPQSGLSQATSRIDSRIGTEAWNNALGQQVVMMVTDRQQQAEIHLNPADMGPIKVTLTLDNNQASLSFLVHQSATREAIESALPRLNEMMAESGINLGQTNVQADTSGGFAQSGQFGRTTDRGPAQPGNDKEIPQSRSAAPTITRMGLVDRFV